MTPHDFIAKWKKASDLSERSACQQHFLDLCDLLGEKKPAEVDPSGAWFTFEKGLTTTEGRKGFADVWRRGFFGWEYKGKHKDLKAAYQQLLRYHEALLNPPLLIVCDLERFEVHTKFPNTVKEVHQFDLDGLADPKNVQLLRSAFTDPDLLRPGRTQKQLTEEVVATFANLADGMRDRHIEPQRAGHFLMKLMFCMFAEDIDLLPKDLFLRTVQGSRWEPKKLGKLLADLFAAMAHPDGTFGADEIAWFNGGLFADAEVIELTPTEIRHLAGAAEYDWSNIEPSIFGTLFERVLDPGKRAQLGAHYTSREDIETLLGPVLRDPLRREWDAVRAKADDLYADLQAASRAGKKAAARKARTALDAAVNGFFLRLESVTVLDPACGSGNFLYVALRMLLDLEKDVWVYAQSRDITHIPHVGPHQLRGLERNEYAQQLAQVVIWIGYLQWMKESGIRGPGVPVLDRMDNITCQDAILDLTDPAQPKEPDWPDAEFIVGNPPFLGNKLMRSKLGAEYAEAMWGLYSDRIPAMSDLCAYWFEKARAMIQAGRTTRAGLLATTGIKQVGGRRVLERIGETGRIFFTESDRPWLLDGAAVRIVMVGYGTKDTPDPAVIDGNPVPAINADLTGGVATTTAPPLAENFGLCFMGTTKVGDFDIPVETARVMLGDPNPHGKPNSDVLRPFRNGSDLVRVSSDRFIIGKASAC